MNIEFLLIMFTVLLVIALYAVWEYNALVSFRIRIDNAWNQLYNLVNSRRMLLLQFVELHNEAVADDVRTNLRTLVAQAADAKTVRETLAVEKMITEQLVVLFDTPAFFADSAYGNALRTLHNIDQRLELAQMLYNDIVLMYLSKLESFPANVIASVYNFSAETLSE
ncbi:MAG: LemA family protein [Culicoidibacterales bacterium]